MDKDQIADELAESLDMIMGMFDLSDIGSLMAKKGESAHYQALISRARRILRKAKEYDRQP